MNATDFITKTIYDTLLADILNGKCVEYEAEKSVNGNRYKLIVSTDDYCWKEYGWISVWYDYNYKDNDFIDGRTIGGGSVHFYDEDVKCYDDFIKCLNGHLKRMPDYDEITQLSLF